MSDIPVKEEIDFGRTAAGDGLNFLQAGNAVHGFFDRSRHRHQHLIDWHDPVVHTNHHTGEIRVGKNRNRNRKGEVSADQRQADDQE